MEILKRSFKAKVTENKEQANGRVLRYLDMDNGAEGTVPEWCITSFVILPKELMDSEGHVLEGVSLDLREMSSGRIYPSTIYERRRMPLQKPLPKRMNKESLYEDALLYQEKTLDDLWAMFADKSSRGEIAKETLLHAFEIKGVAKAKEQYDFLCSLLNMDFVELGMQESCSREFKSSFLHSANPQRTERSYQYQQIFKEIVAFANSHKDGNVFVGIANDGSIRGVEKELLDEAPFPNRADFQKDFWNQMSQSIGNYSFVSSIEIKWYKTPDDKLFCRILVPIWNGGIILLNGCELYVRDDTGKKQLKDNDFIEYILSHSGNKQLQSLNETVA
jgi:divergent AAA domain|uniref:AlbA family DNA-binding domain-containing protein n=1 Tax=Prevotella sp. TaxID=59823 RepID=UPI004027D697